MNKMKKILALALALVMVLGLVACGGGSTGTQTGTGAQTGTGSNTGAQTGTGTYVDPNAGKEDENDGEMYKVFPYLANYHDEYYYEGNINVLYLVCTVLAEYFPNSHAVFEPILNEHNITIELMGPPSYSDESMITTMESALATGKYDLILFYPITPSATTPLLDTLWEQYHVPILAHAFAPETQCAHYYLGTSYYQAGVVAGEAVIEYVNKNAAYFDTLDTIPVAIYKNSAGGEQYARIRGAWETLEKDGRFTLVEEYEANGEAQCLTQTETVLATHPEVEVFLTQIDNSAVGTYQALIANQDVASEYASVWGFDATGAVCSIMAQDGVDGFVQGSSLIDHFTAAQAILELVPILVGAAKKGELIEFTAEEQEDMGYKLGELYVAVTPENVSKYYQAK